MTYIMVTLTPKEHDKLFDALMYAMYRQVGESTKAHPPIEAIRSNLANKYKVKRKYSKKIKNVLKDLVTCGYLLRHKTRGSVTYQFTIEGRDYARNLLP